MVISWFQLQTLEYIWLFNNKVRNNVKIALNNIHLNAHLKKYPPTGINSHYFMRCFKRTEENVNFKTAEAPNQTAANFVAGAFRFQTDRQTDSVPVELWKEWNGKKSNVKKLINVSIDFRKNRNFRWAGIISIIPARRAGIMDFIPAEWKFRSQFDEIGGNNLY